MNEPIVVLISADAEWKWTRKYFPHVQIEFNPLGEFFLTKIKQETVVFQHGGWGKIAAAASAVYVVETWNPMLVINLGTCGGFLHRIERDAILMPDKTLTYDIFEQMSDPQESINFYTTHLNYSWLKRPYPLPVEKGVLVSADRDLIPADIPTLIDQYNARAGDWESASIAWVTVKKYKRRCLILRGVSDLVSEKGGEAYNGIGFFEQSSGRIMHRLLDSLPGWLTCAGF